MRKTDPSAQRAFMRDLRHGRESEYSQGSESARENVSGMRSSYAKKVELEAVHQQLLNNLLSISATLDQLKEKQVNFLSEVQVLINDALTGNVQGVINKMESGIKSRFVEMSQEVDRVLSDIEKLKSPGGATMPSAWVSQIQRMIVQRSLSIPVATDEGGLGTTTRPTSGQVPIGNSNGTYTPGSIPASSTHTIVTTTAVAYAALSTDEIILANAIGGAITVTLPTAVGVSGKMYVIKRLNTGANAVTVATTGGQTIDGDATIVLTMQYTSINLISDGANWSIL